jgi:adenylosuccinate lyase
MHAEITSFGMKFALWFEDFKRLRAKFIMASNEVEVIKLSGAVGTYSTSNPEVQEIAAHYLNLNQSLITTQTLQRDRYAFYISVIALLGSELEKIAIEIRHLSRSEVKEVQEPFGNKQKGSSAMPHKKNPILSENICGLSRILKSYIHVAYDNIALWHERDISHSSTERIILPDATSLIHFMLHRYSNTLENLVVFPENMVHNIELSKGFYATQQILNAMVDQGYDRLSIHDHLQGLSRIVEEKKIHLKDVVLEDEFILSALGKNVIYDLFDYKRSLIHVPSIFKNVFNS